MLPSTRSCSKQVSESKEFSLSLTNPFPSLVHSTSKIFVNLSTLLHLHNHGPSPRYCKLTDLLASALALFLRPADHATFLLTAFKRVLIKTQFLRTASPAPIFERTYKTKNIHSMIISLDSKTMGSFPHFSCIFKFFYDEYLLLAY